ncbi:hypothetical protein [Noviherbaspirillum saxi]|uniref:hypothetical protein n=1 Tax=Noviherbaspirillum saxi TaxID=2320863 RepID=UPI0011C3E8AF|nr:hypothetical protein [Noviherbaspirillum saxi]
MDACTALIDVGLIAARGPTQNVWQLLSSPGSLTLEDVYKCVEIQYKIGLAPGAGTNFHLFKPEPSAITEIDTLMIEVLFNTHQLLLKYFREVYLIRLRPASLQAVFPQFAFVKKGHKLHHLAERSPEKSGISSH